jgi:TolB protein
MIKPPVITPDKFPRRFKLPRIRLRINRRSAAMFLAVNTFVLAFFALPKFNEDIQALSTTTSTTTNTQEIAAPTGEASPTSTRKPNDPSPTPTPVPVHTSSAEIPYKEEALLTSGVLFLALDDGTYSHLFAYHPQTLPLTRLTYGPWEDITPALNPDGNQLAFASNRNGYWNLYLLDLKSGQTVQLTDNPEYEAAPSWSPDGRWLVYETYVGEDGGGLELFILPIDGSSQSIRLTDHPGADHSPSWSPAGRQIAFVSQRSGEPEIWIADLDVAGEERFTNLSRSASTRESYPVWSPDGSRLAWSSNENGYHNLYLWNPGDERVLGGTRTYIGGGSIPAWSPDGESILTLLLEPNDTYLIGYNLNQSILALPPIALPGMASAISWGSLDSGATVPGPFRALAAQTPPPAWQPALTLAEDVPDGRTILAQLDGVTAPYPRLNDMVDEAFAALRSRTAYDTGWDYLSTLENAYLPITSPSLPGTKEDWLYTGRAFAANTLPFNAGWMVVVREDYSQHTYWRVFLKTLSQDGSAGRPLYDQPWDFNARYTGNMQAYEQGGLLSKDIPPGFWVDFTQIARRFDWERLPALPIWSSSFHSARFNQFIFSSGLDWKSAMLEIYPDEVLITPTPIIFPSRTPSPTPRWYQSPTPTKTHTPRPTLTPPPPTPTEAPTSTPTQTPTPTATQAEVEAGNPAPTPTRTPRKLP